MFEQWQHTIAANTTEDDMDVVKCDISLGVLTRLQLYFPFGVEYLARCRVLLGNKPILPRSSKGYVTGNGSLIDTGEIVEPIRGNLTFLRWELWNLDETYPHTITLSATWLTEREQTIMSDYLKQSNVYLAQIAQHLSRL